MTAVVLSPEAEEDLWTIWLYLAQEASIATADRVESVLWEKLRFVAKMPGVGHWRRDLTAQAVKFFTVYEYLIVYRPNMRPLQVVAILHGHRDVAKILANRC